jgi:hypothetical protein
MGITDPLRYLKQSGVCDENAYPFVDSLEAGFHCRSNEITPNTIVKIDNYIDVQKNENSIKKAIRDYGPLASGIYVRDSVVRVSHAMALVGYGTIHAGDTITNIYNTEPTGTGITWSVPITENDTSLIGKTYWVFKSSYLSAGYYYIVFENLAAMHKPYSLRSPITWQERNSQGEYATRTDVVCEDTDGDGYFFWGLGSKPANCPSWAPDEPDGDDSNYQYGPMDQYGNLEDLYQRVSQNLNILQDTLMGNRQYVYTDVSVSNGATLTVTDTLTFYGQTELIVNPGCKLIIDGCELQNVDIDLRPSSQLIIRNGGVIVMREGVPFEAPVGAIVEITEGMIK